MVLGGVAGQRFTDYHVIISDQSDIPVASSPVIQALQRIIEAGDSQVTLHHRPPVWGIAEQREYLLDNARSPYVLFLDDDVYMEPWVVGQLLDVIQTQNCGFVGAFPSGLSYREDWRPKQQAIEFWTGKVQPEDLWPEGPGWERWNLHRAANLFHVSQKLTKNTHHLYKVAWVACCVLYDREKLSRVGGFSFWNRLPRYHSGEEVLVQNLLMRLWGGCGMLPSGTYSSELDSTVLNDRGSVDGHALDLLPEMIERYCARNPSLVRSQDFLG